MDIIKPIASKGILGDIFDLDIIMGMLLGWFLFTLFAGMKKDYGGGLGKYLPLPRWIPNTLDFGYIKTDNIIVYAITIVGILLTKGRMRKIFAVALWAEFICHIYAFTQ